MSDFKEAIQGIESAFNVLFHYVAKYAPRLPVGQLQEEYSAAIAAATVDGPQALVDLISYRPEVEDDAVEAACDAFCKAESYLGDAWKGPWPYRKRTDAEAAHGLRTAMVAALAAIVPRTDVGALWLDTKEELSLTARQ